MSDGDRGHTGQGVEDEAVGGEVAVEGQALGAGRDITGTEHEGVGEGRQHAGVGQAVDQGGPIGVASIVGEERGTLVAVEEGVGDLARLDTEDRTGACGRDLVVEGRRRVTEDPRGAGEAAADVGDQVVRTDGEAAKVVQIERDDARQGRGTGEDELVVHARGVEVEAERRAISQRQGHGRVGDGRVVEEIERRAGADVNGTEASGEEAGVKNALRDGDAARAEVGGGIDGDRAGTRLSEDAGGAGQSGDHVAQGERAGLVGRFDRTASRADSEVLAGRGRRGAGVAECAAVDRDHVGAGSVAEIRTAGEGEDAGIDGHRAREGVGAGEDDRTSSGLDQTGGAGELTGDRAAAHIEVIGSGQGTTGTDDRPGGESDSVDGFVEGTDVQAAAVDVDEGEVREDVDAADGDAAGVDGRRTAKAIGAREGQRAGAILGERGRQAARHHADQVRIARAGDGEGAHASRDVAGDREGTRVGLDGGIVQERDRSAEGVAAAEITEGAEATEARAREVERLRGDVDVALELERSTRSDDRAADRVAEAVGSIDADRTGVDVDRAQEGTVTAERELAVAGLREARRGAGDVARDDRVARAREGDVINVRDNRGGVVERQSTHVGLDGGRTAEGDGTAEGVRAEVIAQGAVGGVTRTRDCQRFRADGDAALEFERSAQGDARARTHGAEGVGVGEADQAGGNRGRARVAVVTRERDRAGAAHREGTRAGDRVGDGVGVGAVDDQRGVVDDGRGAQRARGRTRAHLDGAGGDREVAREGVDTFEDERVVRGDDAGGLREAQAAVDLTDIANRAGAKVKIIDRTCARTDDEAVEVQRGVIERQGRGDRAGASAGALGDIAADIERSAIDNQGRSDRAGGVAGGAEGDRAEDIDGRGTGDVYAGDDIAAIGAARNRAVADSHAGDADVEGQGTADVQGAGRGLGITRVGEVGRSV